MAVLAFVALAALVALSFFVLHDLPCRRLRTRFRPEYRPFIRCSVGSTSRREEVCTSREDPKV